MKYKTFARCRLGGLIGAGAAVLGGIVATADNDKPEASPKAPTVSERPAPGSASTAALAAAPGAPAGTPSDRAALRPIDRRVLDLRRRPLSEGTDDGASTKLRVKEAGAVIELRADTGKGSSTWNRAKLDLDGDKSFDERWDLQALGGIKREVAPADDENYTQTFQLSENRWVLAGQSGSPTTAAGIGAGATLAPGSLRPIDRDVLELQAEPLANGKADGATLVWRVKQGATVIELRSDKDKGSTSWNRVKLDLDGDKRFDEKWDIRAGGSIKRQVAPRDDESYTETYARQGEVWVKTT